MNNSYPASNIEELVTSVLAVPDPSPQFKQELRNRLLAAAAEQELPMKTNTRKARKWLWVPNDNCADPIGFRIGVILSGNRGCHAADFRVHSRHRPG